MSQQPQAATAPMPYAPKGPVLLMGILFGFLLSRAEATRYDRIAGLFSLTDLHLAGVMAVGIVTAGLGLAFLKKNQIKPLCAPRLDFASKDLKPWQFGWGFLFGIGWALSGACPGTAIAALGEGRLMALFIVAGLMAGTWIGIKTAPKPLAKTGPATSSELPQPSPALSAA